MIRRASRPAPELGQDRALCQACSFRRHPVRSPAPVRAGTQPPPRPIAPLSCGYHPVRCAQMTCKSGHRGSWGCRWSASGGLPTLDGTQLRPRPACPGQPARRRVKRGIIPIRYESRRMWDFLRLTCDKSPLPDSNGRLRHPTSQSCRSSPRLIWLNAKKSRYLVTVGFSSTSFWQIVRAPLGIGGRVGRLADGHVLPGEVS